MLQNKTGPAQQKAAKGYLSGMMVFEFFSANMPSIAAAAGADFLMYDMEHTGITTETLRAQMAACRGLDIAPLVRVPSVEANIIGQVLDIGAHGIMVPMVETAAHRQKKLSAVRITRRKASAAQPFRSRMMILWPAILLKK